MFVLGVDPGLSRCGFAVIEPRRRGGRPVSIGVIRTDPDLPTARRLAEVAAEIDDLLDEFRPTAVAVERIFFQNNVRTAVSVAQVSGIVMAAATRRGADVADYSPNQIKAAVTGDGRADKKQVQTMVQKLLGLNGLPRPADAADAAAIALCHLSHSPLAAVPRPGGPRHSPSSSLALRTRRSVDQKGARP